MPPPKSIELNPTTVLPLNPPSEPLSIVVTGTFEKSQRQAAVKIYGSFSALPSPSTVYSSSEIIFGISVPFFEYARRRKFPSPKALRVAVFPSNETTLAKLISTPLSAQHLNSISRNVAFSGYILTLISVVSLSLLSLCELLSSSPILRTGISFVYGVVTAGNAFSVTMLMPSGAVFGTTELRMIVSGCKPSLSAVIVILPVSNVEPIIARSLPENSLRWLPL